MRDKSDRYQIQTVPALVPPKRLGTYLVDAGLLTADQIKVVLNDQQATGMRFGEIVTARGWVKEQTIEWIVQKVVEPERHHQKQTPIAKEEAKSQPPVHSRPQSLQILQAATQSADAERPPVRGADADHAKKTAVRRDVPISKPLPPVKSPDGDVNWVG
ncbi:MAG TPA: hypothetical protein V6C57_23720 [Coleofasciculaceae cyanobacterium]